ncbi:recombinase family protein [Fusobacterium hwasookii]|jgi:resolvase, N domain protein|uniref:recombinase family protein n=1 Tax=Fusobacterium hwasookii TaxID=1583098 RepID=UPI0028E7D3A2|nr:recombinase family protein [Fusobacterium hwasookii]
MLYGYARVSTAEQSLKRQIKELEARGIDKKNIYKDFSTGKDFKDRIEYQKLLDICSVGDTIVFTSLDRFSRNVKETVKQLEILEKRGLKAIFLKENISTEMKGVAELIISIFSWVAEQERITLLERQKRGYEALERNDKGRLISKKGTLIGGKEKVFSNQQLNMLKEYKEGKSTYNLTQLAKILEVSRPTIYKKLKEI